RDLVTALELRTAMALRPDFAGQRRDVYGLEPEAGEHFRPVGQGVDSPDSEMAGVFHHRLGENSCNAAPLLIFGNCPRAELGELSPVDVQGAAADDFPVLTNDDEVAGALVQLGERSGEHIAAIREIVDDFVDLRNVRHRGPFGVHDLLPLLTFAGSAAT